MANPSQTWQAWCSLSLQAARLTWAAQDVVVLRCMRIAAESLRGRQSEARRMVAEKIAALAEAQTAAAIAAIKGGSSNHVTKRALGVYKKRVHRNRRRLTK